MSEVRMISVKDGKAIQTFDEVASEEPLEIRLLQNAKPYHSLAVTMRTPGNDFELVAGFLFSEGLIAKRAQIKNLTYCVDKDVDEEQRFNIVNAAVPGHAANLERLERHLRCQAPVAFAEKRNSMRSKFAA